MRAANRPVATQILVIRHAEKPALFGVPSGVDVNGEPHPHSLIVRGWQRAGALVPFFCDLGDAAIHVPTRVFSPPSHGADGDHGRPYETVIALADRIGVRVETRFSLDEEDALVAAATGTAGVALIAWEHKRIPRIASGLLRDTKAAPKTWPDDRFDVVWVFDYDANTATYRFSQRPQLLLAGDRADPIGHA